jgi:beta-N-acetylhexosaminidase
MKNSLAVILSLAGETLSDTERSFFKDCNPLGFILFARNCKSPSQLAELTSDLKESLGRDCPILIDQEGGRVQRLKPPAWRQYPPMKDFGDMALENESKALEDLRFSILQLASELGDAGINVNCAPVLDVLTPQTHDAIGDRAFSDRPEIVARLGLSVCRTLLAAGITPVIKHLPGHGRALVDSHKDLPRVSVSAADLEADFKPFRDLAAADVGPALWGMAAHVIYEQIDPDHPASVSPRIVGDVIRKNIGFDGLLLSDDVDMAALCAYGDAAERCAASLAAGCDVALYCAGKLQIMEKIAKTVPKLAPEALRRLQKAAEFRKVAA